MFLNGPGDIIGACRSADRGRPASASGTPSPAAAGRDPVPRYHEAQDRQEYRPTSGAEGRRPAVRPASATAALAWDKPKELPRAPPPGTTSGE